MGRFYKQRVANQIDKATEENKIKRLEEKEIKNLQDIKDEVYQEVGYKGGEITGDEVDMIAERYAKEAVKQFANQLIDDSYHLTSEDGDTVRVVQVEDIEGRVISLP